MYIYDIVCIEDSYICILSVYVYDRMHYVDMHIILYCMYICNVYYTYGVYIYGIYIIYYVALYFYNIRLPWSYTPVANLLRYG